MKRIKNLLLSSAYSLQERLFLLGGIIGTVSMIGASVIATLSGEGVLAWIGPTLGTLFVAFVTYYAFKTKQIYIGAAIITLISTIIVLPYGFFKGGGVYSGSPIWFVIGIVVVFLFFKGRRFYIYYFAVIAAFVGAVYVSYHHPELVSQLTSEKAIYADVILATIIVATIVGSLLHFQSVVLEKEIELTEDQQKRIEALNDAQNRFFSSMSHEIRTPINTIIGLNEMTLREKNLSEEVVENSLTIQSASKMLLALINDILDLSKIQSKQMKLTEAQYETSVILSEVVNLLWNRAKEKGLQFNIHVGENIPSMLYGDEMRVKQVIINLLTNAIKYTSEGSVTLTVDGDKINSNTFNLRISVEDTGQGIRKENIAYLFDTFKRLGGAENKAIEGTGLGLTITKQLVELMNGQITVDSVFTKGSTFRVVIPQKIMSETPLNFKTITEEKRSLENYEQAFEAPDAHVLIVDDNDMNRMVCRKLLRDTLVQVDVAASGKECLEKTAQIEYDAIFMDHEMPDMDGIETLRRIRNQKGGLCHNTPVIALTANAGSDRNAFYLDHGFQAYLAKPIHGALLEATLLNVLPKELIEKAAVIKEEDIVQVLQNKHKRDYIISTDSVCGLNADVLEKHDIRIMPYYITTSKGRFKDTLEMDADNLYYYILEKGKDVTTEPSSVSEYEAFFGNLLTEADSVIHFSASTGISSGYNNARIAAESFNNVTVVDTKAITSGLGMIVLYANDLLSKGMSIEEVIKAIDGYRSSIEANFLIPSIDMAMRRKKMSPITKLFVDVLNFEPSFTIKNGVIKVKRYFLGYLNDARVQYIISNFYHKKNIDTSKLYVVYSGLNEEERMEIVQNIERCIHFDEIIFHKASATLSANIGTRYLGFIYRKL